MRQNYLKLFIIAALFSTTSLSSCEESTPPTSGGNQTETDKNPGGNGDDKEDDKDDDKKPETEQTVFDNYVARTDLDPYVFDDSDVLGLEAKSLYKTPDSYTNPAVKKSFSDYGIVSNDGLDQSDVIQDAINDVHNSGGGHLLIPKGIYYFSEVYMQSNVHLIVEPGTVFKPLWGEPKGDGRIKTVMLFFSSEYDKTSNTLEVAKYIKDCSIRCSVEGERYTIDYSDKKKDVGTYYIRFIICKMVKNFYIADFNILDSYTGYCGISIVPLEQDDVNEFPVDDEDGKVVKHPRNGQFRNLSMDCGSPGYGLCQMHCATNLYFENLYSLGGVTLRLETGAASGNGGVDEIYARNIKSENGRCSVMFGPHTVNNGTFIGDGFWSKGSACTVQAGKGFIDENGAFGETEGSFANDTKVINVYAIFGTEAQYKYQNVWMIKESEYKYFAYAPELNDDKWLHAATSCAVSEGTEKEWTLTVENVAVQGFAPDNDSGIRYTEHLPYYDCYQDKYKELMAKYLP